LPGSPKIKITYNSPVILSFSLICIIALILGQLSNGHTTNLLFINHPSPPWNSALTYLQLVSHVIGHANWGHLAGNFSIILLIGPLLEEKYGSSVLLEMFLFTALITGLANSLFFPTGLLGASGIAFMLILLGSLSNFKAGEIPLTFILVAFIFLGSEIITSFAKDNISQFAHIVGGLSGAFWGFIRINKG
jgi:rhomboid protease GluP